MADEPVSRSERIRRAIERLSGSADIKMTTDEIMEMTRGKEPYSTEAEAGNDDRNLEVSE